MKLFFINEKNVNKEVMILGIVNVLSSKEQDNSLELRNNLYKEVTKVVNEKEILPGNFTLSLDPDMLFHIMDSV